MITLTTDFGLTDEYAGVMKGVILAICPSVRIVDLTHGIRPQDVRQAALIISSAYKFFPDGTIHIVVVDPGVGSDRRILLLETSGHIFLLPDNGAASLLPPIERAFHIQKSSLFLKSISATFHGRDIFAPVAAHLACGLHPQATGERIDINSIVRLPHFPPSFQGNSLFGKVIAIDHFGNLTTNIDHQTLDRFCSHDLLKVSVCIASKVLSGVHSTYNFVLPGQPLALLGSRGFIEIGINRGNAASTLKVTLDSEVQLRI